MALIARTAKTAPVQSRVDQTEPRSSRGPRHLFSQNGE